MPLTASVLSCTVLLLVLWANGCLAADLNLSDVTASLGVPLQQDQVGSPRVVSALISPKFNYYGTMQIIGGTFNHTYVEPKSIFSIFFFNSSFSLFFIFFF